MMEDDDPMSMHSGRAKLKDALKKLDHAWRQAREEWHDDVARQFEQERIEPLIDQTRAAISALAPLDEAVQKARHACEPEQ